MARVNGHLNRRDILRGFGFGALGLTLGGGSFGSAVIRAAAGSPLVGEGQLYKKAAGPAKVGLVKGNDCRDIVYQALKKIEDEVLASIGDKKILIKPNFVSTNHQLAATHVDAIRGILDFLAPHYKKQILVGESTPSDEGAFDGFKNYGYLALEKEYDVELVDLNTRPWEYRYVIGRATALFLSDNLDVPRSGRVYYSAAKMKTHDR
jgi:uncharacterized protein (DUF362 family)